LSPHLFSRWLASEFFKPSVSTGTRSFIAAEQPSNGEPDFKKDQDFHMEYLLIYFSRYSVANDIPPLNS